MFGLVAAHTRDWPSKGTLVLAAEEPAAEEVLELHVGGEPVAAPCMSEKPALLVLLLDLIVAPRLRKEIVAIACAGLLLALVPTLSLWGHEAGSDFSGALLIDNLALSFIALFILGGALIVLM